LNLWAVGIVRNEADILRVTVRHHLKQGVDRFLFLDNESTDGTPELLDQLTRLAPLEWRRHPGHFRQHELLTLLAQEAYLRGADWVLPLDADEFWWAPDSTIRSVLERTAAGALRIQLITFVQRREQIADTTGGLLTMTRRVEQPIGSVDEIAALVDSNEIAFVEHKYAPKWLPRARASLAIGWGNHTLTGAKEPLADCNEIVCLHAAIRSRAVLERKVDAARPAEDLAEYLTQAWHVRRWRRIAKESRLEEEWKANSYLDDRLDVYGHVHPLVTDYRLRDLVAPWLGTPEPPWPKNDAPQDEADVSPISGPEPLIRIEWPQGNRIWGISVVRDVGDAIRAHVFHHLSLGFERLLVVDSGSSDDTPQQLAAMASDSRLEWRRGAHEARDSDLWTQLAHEAWRRGASWVAPLAPDEFLYVEGGSLLSALNDSTAGVLLCTVASGAIPCQLDAAGNEEGASSVVAASPRPKWLCRASPYLTLDDSGHPQGGFSGPVIPIDRLTCLRAPLRAKGQLQRIAREALRIEGTDEDALSPLQGRWPHLSQQDVLGHESAATSLDSGRFRDGARTSILTVDSRLRDITSRCLDQERPETASPSAVSSAGQPRVSTVSLPPGDRDVVLAHMRAVRGWLTDAEAEALIRSVEHVASQFGATTCVVEIGSYFGRSTVVLGGTVLRLGSDVPVFAIDPHLGELGAFDSEVGTQLTSATYREFQRTLSAANVTQAVSPIRRHSFEIEWTRPIGLLLIDALHDRASVHDDARRFMGSVVPGGLVAFHDYSHLFPGVMAEVDDLLMTGMLRRRELADGLMVLERTDRPYVRRSEPHSAGTPAVPSFSATVQEGSPDCLALAQNVRFETEPADAEIETLKCEVRRGAELIDALYRQIGRLRFHDTTTIDLSAREEAVRAVALANELSTRVNDLLSELANERDRAMTLEAGLDTLSQRLGRGLIELANTQGQVEAARRRVSELNASIQERVIAARQRLDELHQQLSASREGERQTRERLRAAHIRETELDAELQRTRHEVWTLRESWSWRITAPLRRGLDTLLWLKRPRASIQVEPPPPAAQESLPVTPPPAVIAQASARDISVEMRTDASGTELLVISDCVPTPDLDGGSYRLFQMLTQLGAMGHQVTFCADSEAGDHRYRESLLQRGIHLVVGGDATAAHLSRAGHRYRYVLLSRPEIAFRYLFAVRAHAVHAKVIFDTVDLHWVRMQGQARVTGDAGVQERAELFERIELFNARSSDVVLAVSEAERQMLLTRDASLHVDILPVIHPCLPSARGWSERRDLMFIGSYWHKPNEDAVLYFVGEILPLIHRRLPDIAVNIFGSRMPESITSLESPHVRCIGYVEDPQPHYEQARVFIAPLRFGAGVKAKIVQSMSYGVPVVTTSVGTEGLMLTPGTHALIGDTPNEFAEAVIALYTNQELWERVVDRSRTHVTRHFSIEAGRRRLEALFPLSAAHV
jgi:glycosyltransferase involved in cell wall biosynthesis